MKKIKLCDVNPEAEKMLLPEKNDRSGIGVHYMDAFIRPMRKLQLEDGTKFAWKRRGLKLTLTVGNSKGEGLMRRLEVGRNPVTMLNACIQEAARNAGVEILVEEKEIHLVMP